MSEEERTPDELWRNMKEVFKTTAYDLIGKKKRHKPWITETTLTLMDTRRKLKPYRTRSDEDRKAYTAAKASDQRQARQDKKKWLAEQCAQIE